MKILIIGAGNGGLSFAAKLSELGLKIVLYDKYLETILPIIKNNNIITLVEEKKEKKVRLFFATNDLSKAVEDIDLTFIVTPAFAHQSVARDLATFLSDNHHIILHPGRTGGALEFRNTLKNYKIHPTVAETETLLFACRKIHATKIQIYGVKKSVGLAAIPSEKSMELVNILNKYLPYYKVRNSVLETSLRNVGAVLHPTPFLLNIGKIERKENFKFYFEGITPTITSFLEELDNERLTIANSYGFEVPSVLKWLNYNYSLTGSSLYESIQMNKVYRDINAPLAVQSRYILEDVPMGLVPMSHLAKKADIETPLIDSIINSASILYKQNFFTTGRTMEKMGLI